MYKWILLALAVVGVTLYFTGALEFENSEDRVNVSVDKEKAKELGESIKDKLED